MTHFTLKPAFQGLLPVSPIMVFLSACLNRESMEREPVSKWGVVTVTTLIFRAQLFMVGLAATVFWLWSLNDY